jgi:hypothetical protein
MKTAALMLFFSALHILIFSIARACELVPEDKNFLVFWICLALTWAACMKSTLSE